MRKILILLLLASSTVFGQSNLPTSGPISMNQIATLMYRIGEISPPAYESAYSIQQLNSASSLADKTAPYSLSDWYGYPGIFYSVFQDTVLMRTNCPTGYYAGAGFYKVPDSAYVSYNSQEQADSLAIADMKTYAQDRINGGSYVGGKGIVTEGTCTAGTRDTINISLTRVRRSVDFWDNESLVVSSAADAYLTDSGITIYIRVYGIDGGSADIYTTIFSGEFRRREVFPAICYSWGRINKNVNAEILSISPTSDASYIYTFTPGIVH